MNPQALPNLFQDVQWKQLSEKERHQFGRAFLNKTLVGSQASEDLEEILKSEENE